MEWGGKTYRPGDRIPEELAANKAKLRRFWESGWIELAEFTERDVASGQPVAESESPDARPDTTEIDAALEGGVPAGVNVERCGGGWCSVTYPNGRVVRVQGKSGLDELLGSLKRDPVEEIPA